MHDDDIEAVEIIELDEVVVDPEGRTLSGRTPVPWMFYGLAPLGDYVPPTPVARWRRWLAARIADLEDDLERLRVRIDPNAGPLW